MRYRDGTAVSIGDRVTLADPSPVEGAPEIGQYELENRAAYEGIVLGRRSEWCGYEVVVARDIEDAPLALYAADCSSRAGLLVLCRHQAINPAYLRKV